MSINNEFKFHALNEIGKEKVLSVAIAFDELLQQLKSICPVSRELKITAMKLEEACFYAKKSIASEIENQAL